MPPLGRQDNKNKMILILVVLWTAASVTGAFAPSTTRTATTTTTRHGVLDIVGKGRKPFGYKEFESRLGHYTATNRGGLATLYVTQWPSSQTGDNATETDSTSQYEASDGNQAMNGDIAVPTNTDQWVDESKHIELIGLLAWAASISAFILINNFAGPWPEELMKAVPERIWFLGHMLGGMLFGGGVILTTAIEYLVVQNRNTAVLQFWFDKVPLLDMSVVLPGLTLSMISGTGLTTVRYGGLAHAPPHIPLAFWALLVFASWWAITDLTTQGKALNAVLDLGSTDATTSVSELAQQQQPQQQPSEQMENVPDEVTGRIVSNLVSCALVVTVYAIMVMKPGTLHYSWLPWLD